MAKYCSKCNTKIGLFKKFYEDKYCKECYEKIKFEEAEIKRKKEEEKIKLEKATKLAQMLKEKKEKEEKLALGKNYLLYTKFYWSFLLNMDKIPFHYQEVFKNTVTNKFQIINCLLEEVLIQLPKNYNLADIKKLTTYRNSSKIIEKVLKPYVRRNLNSEKYRLQKVDLQRYSPNPNSRILDDVEENSYFLCNSYIINLNILVDNYIKNQSELINVIQENIDKMKKCRENPKYDHYTCMANIEEYELDQIYEILYIYYFYAMLIVYYIYFNKTVDTIINNSELYNIYKKLKSEIHNDNYILEKLYPIYNSLYKKEFDVIFEEEIEFKYLLEIIEEKENTTEKEDFIDINNIILKIDINKYINTHNEEEMLIKVLNELAENIVTYKNHLSINDVLDINIYAKQHLKIIEKIKNQQALKEKERILNGHFDEEKQLIKDSLDYTSITNGYEFETYVANLYSLLGYEIINLTSKSGDQGADIIMEKDNLKYAVQVKFYSNPVGNKAVQEIVAAQNFYKTNKAMVVTNSTFTKQAEQLAGANDIILIDGKELEQLKKQIEN